MLKKNVAYQFKSGKDATNFVLEKYSKFVDSELSEEKKKWIGHIQASGFTYGQGNDYKIKAIEECLNNKKCPEISYDIVAWRNGKMKFKKEDRPFVSATFLKDTALRYGSKKTLHKIIIKKGAKIFPLRALGYEYGDGEAEIIIDTSKLKKKIGYYVYE